MLEKVTTTALLALRLADSEQAGLGSPVSTQMLQEALPTWLPEALKMAPPQQPFTPIESAVFTQIRTERVSRSVGEVSQL